MHDGGHGLVQHELLEEGTHAGGEALVGLAPRMLADAATIGRRGRIPMPESAVKPSGKTKTVPYDVAEQLRTPEKMTPTLMLGWMRPPTMLRALRVRWAIALAPRACHRSPAKRSLAGRAYTRPSAKPASQASLRFSRSPARSA